MDVAALAELRRRYEDHLNAGNHPFAERPVQLELARDIVSHMGETSLSRFSDSGVGFHQDRGYFVRPTGTGKTTNLIDFLIGVNEVRNRRTKRQKLQWDNRVLVLTPTGVLRDQFVREMGAPQFRVDGERIIPENRVLNYNAEESQLTRREARTQAQAASPDGEHIDELTREHVREQIVNDSERVVVMTYDMARLLFQEGVLTGEDFPVVLLDEIHSRPRGDTTGEFISNHLFGPSYVLGATATDTYLNGYTIGDYLFEGEIPIHRTMYRRAINEREITGFRNAIVETGMDPGVRVTGDREYTEAELQRIVNQEGRDETAIRILMAGGEPTNGHRYYNMEAVWYAGDVNHAHRLAEKINREARRLSHEDAEHYPELAHFHYIEPEEANEEDNTPYSLANAEEYRNRVRQELEAGHCLYAVPLSGRDDRQYIEQVLEAFRAGRVKHLVNNKLLELGLDVPNAEAVWELAPTRSPITALQRGGRSLRLSSLIPNKIANIISFVDQNVDQILFGEMAMGFAALDDTFVFPPTAGGDGPTPPPPPYEWPHIDGLNVHYDTRELTMFAERRARERHLRGAARKPADMLTPEEMAHEMLSAGMAQHVRPEDVNVLTEALRDNVYNYLAPVFLDRQLRQQYIDPAHAPRPGQNQPPVQVRSQRFPVSSMGYFNHEGESVFCVNRNARHLCLQVLLGQLDQARPELLRPEQARSFLGIPPEQFNNLLRQLQLGVIQRQDRQRVIQIEGVSFPLDHVGYFNEGARHSGQVGFYLYPEALIPLHQLWQNQSGNNIDRTAAENWYNSHSILSRLKGASWLNRDEVALQTHIRHDDTHFTQLWRRLETTARRRTVNTREVVLDSETIPFGRRQINAQRLDQQGNEVFALREDYADWFRDQVHSMQEKQGTQPPPSDGGDGGGGGRRRSRRPRPPNYLPESSDWADRLDLPDEGIPSGPNRRI